MTTLELGSELATLGLFKNCNEHCYPDMRFVKNFTPLISLNFNTFGDDNTKTRVKMEKFTPLAKILHSCRQ